MEDAEKKYFAVVTDLGTREMMKAVSEKRKVNITQFAAGDGGGQYCVPDAAMTGLRNEVWRGGINTCRISGESENVMIVETVIPSDEGGFTIREMAVFDENGVMIAVCNTPDTAKVRVTDGVVHELLLKMEILLNNRDSVQLVTDPNIVVATKQDLEILKNELLAQMFRISYDEEAEMLVIRAAGGNTEPGGGGSPGSGGPVTEGGAPVLSALPAATADTLGGVKVGSGLSAEKDGTISVDISEVASEVAESVSGKAAEKAAEIVESGIGSVTEGDVAQLFDGGQAQHEWLLKRFCQPEG